MKSAKRILCLIVVLGICFSLCGCGVLDRLRASRATVTADGTIKLYDGTEYKPLPECEELSPAFGTYEEQIYVAEEELPLLLTVFSENYLEKSDDGRILMEYTEDAFIYYCRADIYDSVFERIQNGFTPDLCCYWCFDYENMEDVCYTLTQAQMDLVEQVISTQEPDVLPEAASLNWEYMADLRLCTEDRLFEQDTVDICLIKEKYYVVDFDGAISLYSVPAELTAEFAKIMQMQIQYDSYWNDWE